MLKKRFLFILLLSVFVIGSISLKASGSKEDQVAIAVSAVGDCTLGSFPEVTRGKSFFDVFNNQKKDYSYFFKNAPSLKTDDLSIINLEGTFTTSENKAIKKWRFKSNPEFATVLKKAEIEAAVISNNHIYDYGTEGFSDTVKTLKLSDIAPVGEGYKPILNIKGKRIALLSYNVLSNIALVDKNLKKDIAAVIKDTDLIIVSFHWGIEYTYYPLAAEQKLAREAVDLGADLILGTHPHVLQGIEYYKNRYIVYSLGNFVFGGNEIMDDKKHIDHDTLIFTQKFNFKGNELIPKMCKISFFKQSGNIHFNDYCPIQLKGSEEIRVKNKIFKLSKNLKYGLKSTNLLP